MAVKNLQLYSQRLDFKNKLWQKNGCAIASLLMLMEYLPSAGRKLPTLNDLYQVGLNRGAYIPKVGWRHSGLVGLAKIYGFKTSRAFDLAKLSDEEAQKILQTELKIGPVLASVFYNYEPGQGGHIVCLLSLNKVKAVVLDPDSQTKDGVLKELPTEKFISAWKKRFIAVRG